MTRDDFEREFDVKIKFPYQRSGCKDWHNYVVTHIYELSDEAVDAILDNSDIFGDWLIEACAGRILERALNLQVS